MVRKGQMNSGNLAHNGSFIVILPVGENGAEVGVKLQWGDFDKEDVADMSIAVSDPHIATMLLVQGWSVDTGTGVAEVPANVEVYVMPEQESYWRTKENDALVEQVAGGNDWYPAEGKMFKPLYVRAFAMGIWKNSHYTHINNDWNFVSDAKKQWERERGEK